MSNSPTSITEKTINLEILKKFQESNPTVESFGNLCSGCNNYFTIPVGIGLSSSDLDRVSLSTHCQYCYMCYLTLEMFQQYLMWSNKASRMSED